MPLLPPVTTATCPFNGVSAMRSPGCLASGDVAGAQAITAVFIAAELAFLTHLVDFEHDLTTVLAANGDHQFRKELRAVLKSSAHTGELLAFPGRRGRHDGFDLGESRGTARQVVA